MLSRLVQMRAPPPPPPTCLWISRPAARGENTFYRTTYGTASTRSRLPEQRCPVSYILPLSNKLGYLFGIGVDDHALVGVVRKAKRSGAMRSIKWYQQKTKARLFL